MKQSIFSLLKKEPDYAYMLTQITEYPCTFYTYNIILFRPPEKHSQAKMEPKNGL